MLQELRVAQTGVQILFAFLLSLSFTERFTRIDDFQRWTYVITLLLDQLTTGLLVAPAAIHRMLFGRGVKAATVRIGHHLFVAGLAALALTLVGAVLLVLDVAVGRSFALWSAGALGVLLVGLWFGCRCPFAGATTPRAWTATTRSDTHPEPKPRNGRTRRSVRWMHRTPRSLTMARPVGRANPRSDAGLRRSVDVAAPGALLGTACLDELLEVREVALMRRWTMPSASPAFSTKPCGSWSSCSVTRVVSAPIRWKVTTPDWWVPSSVVQATRSSGC